MSLREEMWKYEQITGESAEHVPIIKLGAFLDGYDMGVKALEQTELNPSYNGIKSELEDCISRTELLSRIDAERKHLLDLKMDGAEHIIVHHARRIIEDMPSVTPKTRWIPVSERLPEENIHVLCKFYMGGMAECYHAHDYWHIVGGFRIKIDDVLAWMPLPEGYKAESEDKE